MTRFKINLEYDGTNLIGWQENQDGPSVQSLLQDAIFQFCGEKTTVFSAGRTDAGVHAINMVAHFDLEREQEPETVMRALNFYLAEKPVSVLHCEKVSDDFYSRFSCVARHYKYIVINRSSPIVLKKNRAWWVPQKLDVDAISLEVKQVLGITFDPNIVEKSNINLLELRDAIVRTAKERRKELKQEEDNKALLIHNDYMIANIPEILESSFCVKSLVSMTMGMENQAESLANIKFSDTKKRLLYESYKHGLKSVMGIPLTSQEFKELEQRKRILFSMIVKKDKDKKEYEVKESNFKENNTGVIAKLKAIKARLEKEDKSELQHIDKKITKQEKKNQPVNIEKLYSNLSVRPMKFFSTIVNGKKITKLVIVREEIAKLDKNVNKTSSK